MLFTYGKANGNAREAGRMYQATYPQRQQPTHKTFAGVYRRLRKTGTLVTEYADVGRTRTVRTPEMGARV